MPIIECQTAVECNHPPEASCSGTRRTIYTRAGNCVNGKCGYLSTTVDCANNNGWVDLPAKKCQNGAAEDALCSIQEYREYTCTPHKCVYSVTNVQPKMRQTR